MAFVISSVLPFPNILWWCRVADATMVQWELHEHFEKMTYRNRYYLAGGNGLLQLSIPIQGGRERKSVVSSTKIASGEKWQQQHWRTIVSAYNNAPYFEFFAASLEQLFLRPYSGLAAFNLAGIHWLKMQLGLSFDERNTAAYEKNYPDAFVDLRSMKPGPERCTDCDFPPYYQVFQERNGFLPNLSVLDLLFAEGRYAKDWIMQNKDAVIGWRDSKIS